MHNKCSSVGIIIYLKKQLHGKRTFITHLQQSFLTIHCVNIDGVEAELSQDSMVNPQQTRNQNLTWTNQGDPEPTVDHHLHPNPAAR